VTRRVRRSDIPLIAVDQRHIGELLLYPCHCGRDDCTLGEHVWRTASNLTPGIRAQNFDPVAHIGGPPDDNLPFPDIDEPVDQTAILFDEYRRRLRRWRDDGDWLGDLINALRPDRDRPKPEKTSVEDWCTSCLRIGKVEPRYRGDLCRWDYDLCRAYVLTQPPIELVKARHEGKRITQQTVDEALARVRPRRKKKRAS
jgi:hypothetical protein